MDFVDTPAECVGPDRAGMDVVDGENEQGSLPSLPAPSGHASPAEALATGPGEQDDVGLGVQNNTAEGYPRDMPGQQVNKAERADVMAPTRGGEDSPRVNKAERADVMAPTRDGDESPRVNKAERADVVAPTRGGDDSPGVSRRAVPLVKTVVTKPRLMLFFPKNTEKELTDYFPDGTKEVARGEALTLGRADGAGIILNMPEMSNFYGEIRQDPADPCRFVLKNVSKSKRINVQYSSKRTEKNKSLKTGEELPILTNYMLSFHTLTFRVLVTPGDDNAETFEVKCVPEPDKQKETSRGESPVQQVINQGQINGLCMNGDATVFQNGQTVLGRHVGGQNPSQLTDIRFNGPQMTDPRHEMLGFGQGLPASYGQQFTASGLPIAHRPQVGQGVQPGPQLPQMFHHSQVGYRPQMGYGPQMNHGPQVGYGPHMTGNGQYNYGVHAQGPVSGATGYGQVPINRNLPHAYGVGHPSGPFGQHYRQGSTEWAPGVGSLPPPYSPGGVRLPGAGPIPVNTPDASMAPAYSSFQNEKTPVYFPFPSELLQGAPVSHPYQLQDPPSKPSNGPNGVHAVHGIPAGQIGVPNGHSSVQTTQSGMPSAQGGAQSRTPVENTEEADPVARLMQKAELWSPHRT